MLKKLKYKHVVISIKFEIVTLSTTLNIQVLLSTMENTVKFNVHKVDVVNPNTVKNILHYKTNLKDLVVKRLSTKTVTQSVEAVSDSSDTFYGFQSDGLFNAVHDAYDNHVGIKLITDDIHLKILQGFAMHLGQDDNSEKFRHLFVNHEGKKKIVIRRDEFRRGQQNDWTTLFSEFADKIRADVKDPKLVELAQKSFQTTTPTTMASFNIALMETVQKYYSYGLTTRCGIPFVELGGSVDDWASLIDLVNYIEQFDLKWWTDKLRPILAEFVNAANGNADVNFWGNILKIDNESGGPYYNGWFINFYPYLVRDKSMVRNSFKKTTFRFPSGLSTVPVEWDYFGEIFNMNFTAGFFGYTTTNDTICPEISWVVHEAKTLTPKELVDPDIKNVFLNGEFYNPASKHYTSSNGVNCDYCKVKDIKQCIGIAGGKIDLCMKCVDTLDKLLK